MAKVVGQSSSHREYLQQEKRCRLCLYVTRRDKGTVGWKADLNWKLQINNTVVGLDFSVVFRPIFYAVVCVYVCGVMLAAFLCPVIVVEFYTILGPILVFTLYYLCSPKFLNK